MNRTHTVTRRGLIQGGVGAAAVATVGTLAACGSDDAASSGKKVLRFGVKNPKVSLDAQKSTSGIGVERAVTEPLLELDPETKEIKPLLVKELPTISEDGLTYSFELKDGVTFHDGSTLTSSDVQYTFTRRFLPATKSDSTDSYVYIKGAQDMLDGETTELAGFEVTDDTHFTITLEQPYSSFSAMLSQFMAAIYPEKACTDAGESWGTGTTFIGTGPYKITSNDDATEAILEAYADYHGDAPGLDEIDVVYIDDANTLVLNYKNDDIDLAFIDRTLIGQYKDDASIKDQIVSYTPGSCQFVNLNLKNEHLADERVREALSLAINRQEICDTTLSGAATPATSFIPSSCTGYDDSLDVLPYDPDKAKELLSQAGADGITLDCQVRSQDQAVATVLQDSFSKVGVTLNVSVIDSGVWSDSRKNGDLTVTTVTWSTLSFQGIDFMGSYFRSDRSSSRSVFYDSPEFDALVDEARQTVNDQDRVIDLTKQADHKLVLEDYACIPIDWPQMPYVLKPGFTGLQVLVNPLFGRVTKQ